MSDDVTREIVRQLADLRERLARLEGSEYVANAGTLTNSNASVTAGGIATFETLHLGGQAVAGLTQNYVSLADDASANMFVEAGAIGFFMILTNEAASCLGVYTNSVGVVLIHDSSNVFSITDTDGKHCILLSGADLQIKNRRGGPRNYRIHRFY